jgi:hypothetical protein
VRHPHGTPELKRKLVGERRLPESRGPDKATLVSTLSVSATSLANASIPMIFDGSSTHRSQMNGFSALITISLYRLTGATRYREEVPAR